MGFLILGKEDRVGSQTWRGKGRGGVVKKEEILDGPARHERLSKAYRISRGALHTSIITVDHEPTLLPLFLPQLPACHLLSPSPEAFLYQDGSVWQA